MKQKKMEWGPAGLRGNVKKKRDELDEVKRWGYERKEIQNIFNI